MVAEVTLNHRAPLIVSEEIDGETMYAVVTHNPYGSHPSKKVKDGLRVVCAACYKEGASLNDDRFAKTFSSCLSHWNAKGGVRNFQCLPADGGTTIDDIACKCPRMSLDFSGKTYPPVENASTNDLIAEIRRRNKTIDIDQATDEQVLAAVRARNLTYDIMFDTKCTTDKQIHNAARARNIDTGSFKRAKTTDTEEDGSDA